MNASICMTTYNGARFVKAQLDSILSQLGENDEIIISDDQSKDNTIEIIKAFQDPRIKLIENKNRSGLVKNFEAALQQCNGEIIFLCDQDDIWEREKLATMKHYLQNYDLVVADCSIIDEKGQEMVSSFFQFKGSRKGIINNLLSNSYMGCCMAFHKRILERAFPFPKKIKAHDQWLGLIADKYYTVFFLNQRLVQYRRHGNNHSFTGEKSAFTLLEKINHRLHMFYNLYTR